MDFTNELLQEGRNSPAAFCSVLHPDGDGVTGNALISNVRLEKYFCWDLSSPNMGQKTRYNAIGTYLSELSLPMWVITLHLTPFDECETRWQLHQLANQLEDLRNKDLVLVVGDFNIGTGMDFDLLYQEMLQKFRTLGYDRLGGRGRDHVFLRDHRNKLLDARVETYPPMWEIRGYDVKVTDHYLIIIDLKWPSRQVISRLSL
jgi:endonuclease/exonuclease/phosphatase family metal-dependent hydrolase